MLTAQRIASSPRQPVPESLRSLFIPPTQNPASATLPFSYSPKHTPEGSFIHRSSFSPRTDGTTVSALPSDQQYPAASLPIPILVKPIPIVTPASSSYTIPPTMFGTPQDTPPGIGFIGSFSSGLMPFATPPPTTSHSPQDMYTTVVGESEMVDFGNELCQDVRSSSIVVYKNKPMKYLNNQYLIGPLLGMGSYGKVKEGIDIISLRRVAIKIINYGLLSKVKGKIDKIKIELTIQKRLEHPNVTKLIDVIRKPENQKIYIIFELLSNGDLKQLQEMLPEKRFPIPLARK
jgi:hypothetical protein